METSKYIKIDATLVKRNHELFEEDDLDFICDELIDIAEDRDYDLVSSVTLSNIEENSEDLKEKIIQYIHQNQRMDLSDNETVDANELVEFIQRL